MKIVVNNLIWLALVSLMVSASFYPGVSSIAQAVIWVIVSIILVFGPLGVVATYIADKDRLTEIAGKNKGAFRVFVGWTKLAITFSAIAYAGFTVAAIFYLLGALVVILNVYLARDRLKEMA